MPDTGGKYDANEPREMTDEEVRGLNEEMADGIIAEIGEALRDLGSDIADLPPMWYPEAVKDVAGAYWRKGLFAAAEYMISRKVTASQFYADAILALPMPEEPR